MGYEISFITYEYGIINGYALSTLLLPQFFIQNMSSSLVPEVSKYYSVKNKYMCKKRIKEICFFSSLIGLISTIIIFIFPEFFLNTLYNTTEGIEYIRLLAPFTILFYIECPLISAMQALNLSKKAVTTTIISSILRLSSIVIFSLLKVGMYSIIIAIIINLIVSTYMYYHYVKNALN